MKIQIVSDLHLEFPANRLWLELNPITPSADILLIAGDSISINNLEPATPFIKKLERDFPLIISTLGNHEFYGSNIEIAYPRMHRLISPNHHCLNNQVYVHGNLRFIVTILWSKVSEACRHIVESGLNDYHHISVHQPGKGNRLYRVEDSNALFDKSLKFIKDELAKPFSGKTILLTHHLPSYKCIPEVFKESPLCSGFASNLDELILDNPQITHWVYGHAHDFHEVKIGDTLLIRNPLGYVDHGDHQDFRRDFCVEL